MDNYIPFANLLKAVTMPTRCLHCQTTFSRHSSLVRHVTSKHDGEVHQCTLCSTSFKRRDILKRHEQRQHSDGQEPCSSCSETHEGNSRSAHQARCSGLKNQSISNSSDKSVDESQQAKHSSAHHEHRDGSRTGLIEADPTLTSEPSWDDFDIADSFHHTDGGNPSADLSQTVGYWFTSTNDGTTSVGNPSFDPADVMAGAQNTHFEEQIVFDWTLHIYDPWYDPMVSLRATSARTGSSCLPVLQNAMTTFAESTLAERSDDA